MERFTHELPPKLLQWAEQPGVMLSKADLAFLFAVRLFAELGEVGYGFMQQLIEWEWQQRCAREGSIPVAWGPEYFEQRIKELTEERDRLARQLYGKEGS